MLDDSYHEVMSALQYDYDLNRYLMQSAFFLEPAFEVFGKRYFLCIRLDDNRTIFDKFAKYIMDKQSREIELGGDDDIISPIFDVELKTWLEGVTCVCMSKCIIVRS